MKHILFVDDEPKLLDGLKRMLYPYRNEWETVFKTSGEEALQELANMHFDVLVADIRMPVMNGVELLTKVRDTYPEVVRIVLSGQADKEMMFSAATLAHQYLAKPCDAEALRKTVERAVTLHVVLEQPALKQVISRIQSLPSIPSVYVQLMDALKGPDASAKQIGAIIRQDLAMAAKIVQLVNSSAFGLQRRIADPAEAVVYLGTETIRSLALSVSLFSEFRSAQVRGFSLESLRDHGTAVGALARLIAKSMKLSKSEVDEAFLGGLLHEIGKLVLVANYPREYEEAVMKATREQIRIANAERQIFGTTHAHVGAYLLWLWGLPPGVIESVTSQCRPLAALTAGPALAVHVADSLLTSVPENPVDAEALAAVGVSDRLPEWERLREEVTMGVAV